MSAEIKIFPGLHVERPERPNDTLLALHLSKWDFGRLERLAREWNLTDAEAAEMLLSEAMTARNR